MRWEVEEEPPVHLCPGIYHYDSVWKFFKHLLIEHEFGELSLQNGGICMPNDNPMNACIGVVFYKEVRVPDGLSKEIFMVMDLGLSAILRIQSHVTLADLDLLRTEFGRQKLFLHSEEIEAFLQRNPNIETL